MNNGMHNVCCRTLTRGMLLISICLTIITTPLIVRAERTMEEIPDIAQLPSNADNVEPEAPYEPKPNVVNHMYAAVFDSTFANVDGTKPWDLDTPFTDKWFYGFFDVDSKCQVTSGNYGYDLFDYNGIEYDDCEDLKNGTINGFHCMNKIRTKHNLSKFDLWVTVGGQDYQHNLKKCLCSSAGIKKLATSAKKAISDHKLKGIEWFIPDLTPELAEPLSVLVKTMKNRNINCSVQLSWSPVVVPKLKNLVNNVDILRPRFFELSYSPFITAPMAGFEGTAANKNPQNSIIGFYNALKAIDAPRRRVFATLPSYALKWDGVDKAEFDQIARRGFGSALRDGYRPGGEPYKFLFDKYYTTNYLIRKWDSRALSSLWYSMRKKELLAVEGYLSIMIKASKIINDFDYKGVVLAQPIDDYCYLLQIAAIKGIFFSSNFAANADARQADYDTMMTNPSGQKSLDMINRLHTKL